jgi:hypothetical protein
MKNSTATTSSFPLCSLMFLLFLTLKLCHVIAWSWFWVTAPLWFPVAIIVAILLTAGAAAAIVAIISALSSSK